VIRLASILIASLWISGCFVADEIKKGDALIEQHSVGWREKKKHMQQAEAEAAKAEAEAESQKQRARSLTPGVKDKLADWWQETVEEEPETADPSDKLVRCTIGSSVQFVRRSDCELRRGRAVELKSGAASSAKAPSSAKRGD